MPGEPSAQEPDMDGLALVLRQFWRLLEFTRDISRNEHDAAYAKDGGKIIYVFDENVFELFIRPRALARYAELFHSSIWLPRPTIQPELRQFSAQSALVTSEYLFSGQLPGQSDGRIYMTEWHFNELSSRRSEWTTQLRNEIASLEGVDAESTAAQNLRKTGEMEAIVDPLTATDLESFAKHTADVSALERFRDARLAARYLVSDDFFGQMHQATRIGSREIASRIVPLGVRFRPSSEERAVLRNEKREWLDALRGEQRRREREIERHTEQESSNPDFRSPRADRGLQNDADALAYLLWIARTQLGPKERIVLVTGDNLLFDVYRSDFVDRLQGEKFVLRRIAQYVPIINLNDAPSDVGNSQRLFQSTREAVEAALFVFNLSDSTKNLDQLHKGREHLALALSQYRNPGDNPAIASFSSNLTREWVDQRKQDFGKLVHLWQEMERFCVGVNYDLIMRRYSAGGAQRARELARDGNREAYIRYLKELLDELVSGSIRLFFPFATNFIRSIAESNEFALNRRPRVPIALRLQVPDCLSDPSGCHPEVSNLIDLHTLLEGWRERDEAALRLLDVDHNPTLSKRPDIVYMIAAVLALEAGEWNDAERFSELAKSADPLIPVDERESENDRFEALYLFAVSKRFRLGSIEPGRSGVRSNIWHVLLDAAVDSLTLCEVHHSRKSEPLRQLRAVSERAAARLFFVSWAIATAAEPNAARKFESSEVLLQFELSIGDLRKCLELEAQTKSAATNERRLRFFGRVERQYVINLASAQVILHLLKRHFQFDGDALTDAEIGHVNERLSQWLSDSSTDRLPLAAQADVLAFFAFEHGDRESINEFVNWARQNRGLGLAMDRAFVAALVRVIPSISS